MYIIEVQNGNGDVLAHAEGEGDARLTHLGAYHPGDVLVFTAPQAHVTVQVDQAVQPAEVFLPQKGFTFHVPFGDATNGYAPQAFAGEKHAITLAPVPQERLSQRRNLARNPADQRGAADGYPHAMANVETRGEAQFWARNAIDGARFNAKHGGWPFHSWGIGERTDAWLRVDFGRPVIMDEIGIVLRADFPHDAWWEYAVLEGSDGISMELALEKTAEVQRFACPPREVTWVRLHSMRKADDPSPYPALTQLEVYGHDAR